jgi:heat shock protein HslJ
VIFSEPRALTYRPNEMIRSRRAVVGLLLGTVLLTSCGEEALPLGNPFGHGTWQLVAGEADGAPLALIPTHPVTLRVDDDTVGGTSACNHYGGTLRLEDNRVSIDEIYMTEMACIGVGIMELEATYLEALGRIDTAAVESGLLVLSGEGVTLRFEAVEPEPDASLIGPTWALETIVDGETASTPATDAWIRFDDDRTVSGHNGCNGFGGSYDPDDGFSDLFQTLIGCMDQGIADQELLFMGVLGSGPTLTIEGTQLTITAPDGRALVFGVSE